ncbi:Major facilitator superfamily domain-containing protein 10 [Psilocybe cubensis]|uniref:Major facilitator superfamily (MFS) profile domain-containing protein n=2 Tax=Psilocybe cubensis TaxID=181762 RepID=A0A8H8CLS2_PSICU|nr:Major facilitator superfamily domain-containing protein 10 [Psilocybe cubensis]KAH9482746.1 Major facilitator superfamily domain-containing protein 10 [Psilocybe cubensis]
MAKVETVVFLSLVLDLFAFTIPLPLFPRIIEWYTIRESSNPNGFLVRTLQFVTSIRSLLYKSGAQSQRWDIVLLGGLMGSVFSTLQFFVSPRIGALSDKYGRKRILLITMIGNILSALIWIQSTTFASYMLSRVVGGLSEGNVQLAIAILSDVTTPAARSKALAHVGIAFAICFCIGPPIGAYFASRPLPKSFDSWGIGLNVYAIPAIITLVLLVAETAFLVVALPETRGKGFATAKVNEKSESNGTHTNGNGVHKPPVAKRSVESRLQILKSLRNFHFYFLALFSGVEFTLTFLTFDLLDWSNTQNGKLIGSIGIISALLQGGYVRRSMTKVGEGNMAQRGVSSCAVGLVLLALMPGFVQAQPSIAMKLLQGAAVCMSFTSATVVNSLTAFASLQCDEGGVDSVTGKSVEEHPQLAKGTALGKFRSSGQLGRALGPLLACASYWTFGPSATYAASALAMFALSMSMKKVAKTKSA